jgi:hypothetical protein
MRPAWSGSRTPARERMPNDTILRLQDLGPDATPTTSAEASYY